MHKARVILAQKPTNFKHNQNEIHNFLPCGMKQMKNENHTVPWIWSVSVLISFEKAAKCLALRHAMTIHKSQSRTLHGHVRICPGKKPGHVSPYFTLKHLLVAASRATDLANLSME